MKEALQRDSQLGITIVCLYYINTLPHASHASEYRLRGLACTRRTPCYLYTRYVESKIRGVLQNLYANVRFFSKLPKQRTLRKLRKLEVIPLSA